MIGGSGGCFVDGHRVRPGGKIRHGFLSFGIQENPTGSFRRSKAKLNRLGHLEGQLGAVLAYAGDQARTVLGQRFQVQAHQGLLHGAEGQQLFQYDFRIVIQADDGGQLLPAVQASVNRPALLRLIDQAVAAVLLGDQLQLLLG